MSVPKFIWNDDPPVDGLVLVIDLEGFSKFCASEPAGARNVVGHLLSFVGAVSDLNTRSPLLALRIPDLTKFTGDGLIMIWKLTRDDIRDSSTRSIGSSIVLFARFIQEQFQEYAKTWKVRAGKACPPRRVRIAIAEGKLYEIRFRGSPKETADDFVGYPINLACRLQKLDVGFVVSNDVMTDRTWLAEMVVPTMNGSHEKTAWVFKEDIGLPEPKTPLLVPPARDS